MPTIHTIDLEYLGIPQAIAAYLVVGPPPRNEPVLIETGPASTLDALVAGVAPHGLKLSDIHHALVTHIHLDHAGAAGHLAAHGTQIHVHEFGVKHLVDPSRLIASATRIYGEQMDRLWGAIVPVAPDRIAPVHDGDVMDIGGLRFTAIETPGHARHHHAFALDTENRRVCFAGDAAGITVPGVDPSAFLAIPTPPPEFDLEAWRASVSRLRREQFSAIYPTHFGVCRDVAGHLDRLDALLIEYATFIRSRLDAGMSRDDILRSYADHVRDQAATHGVSDEEFTRYLSTNLLAMNVDGIIRYWSKGAERATPG